MNDKGIIPNNWSVGRIVGEEEIYDDPPISNDHDIINIFGWSKEDETYRIYSIPRSDTAAEVISYFRVGSKSEFSYGDDPDETISLVTQIVLLIANTIGCEIIFADGAGLKLRFLRDLDEEDLDLIMSFIPSGREGQAGLEHYLSESEPGRHLLSPVLDKKIMHFWWD